MKRLIILGAAVLSLIGLSSLGNAPATPAAEGCTVEVHVNIDVNGTAQGQDLCIPEGVGLPA